MGFTAATFFFVHTCVLVLIGISLRVRFIYQLTLKQETSLHARWQNRPRYRLCASNMYLIVLFANEWHHNHCCILWLQHSRTCGCSITTSESMFFTFVHLNIDGLLFLASRSCISFCRKVVLYILQPSLLQVWKALRYHGSNLVNGEVRLTVASLTQWLGRKTYTGAAERLHGLFSF
jgi:hypothetical protein